MLRRSLAVALLATLAAAPAVAIGDGVVIPVPSTPTTAPAYVGTPATARPIRGVPRVKRNPFMAANGSSSIHNDGWQTDTYRRPGPLGVSPQTLSSSINGVCGSIAFDRRGRIVTVCVGVTRALNLVDPQTLDVIDQLSLPGTIADSAGSGTNPFQGFSGGAYFYLDHHDRAVIGTARRHGSSSSRSSATTCVLKKHVRPVRRCSATGEVLNSGLPGTRRAGCGS